MIAIIDYGAGNLKSVQKALEFIGEEAVITDDKEIILSADRVILPGVGHFDDAMDKINSKNLYPVIKKVIEMKKPFLGICLGLQLLFEKSEESEESKEKEKTKGLELLEGEILKIPSAKGLKIPHIGWNSLEVNPKSRLFKGIKDGSYVYFVHSYYLKAKNEDIVSATTKYGCSIHAAVEKDNVFACQFHPEKSGKVGLQILKNFASL